MLENSRDLNIYLIEEFYCDRMEKLVDLERFDDSHAIFEEFVVDGENPEKWFFMNDLTNVL